MDLISIFSMGHIQKLFNTHPHRWGKVINETMNGFSFWNPFLIGKNCRAWLFGVSSMNAQGGYRFPNHQLEDKVKFVQRLIDRESKGDPCENGKIQKLVTGMAEYYTELMLITPNIRIPKYFAHLCQVYKGIEFDPRRVS